MSVQDILDNGRGYEPGVLDTLITQHNAGRLNINMQVKQILSAVREGSRGNPEILAIDIYEAMKYLSKNRGFPKPMYHATHDPVFARDKQDQKGLEEIGFSPNYVPREYPVWIHRRNFNPRYSFQFSANGQQIYDPSVDKSSGQEFVESRIVNSEAEMAKLLKQPAPAMPRGCPEPGPWVRDITTIAPIETGSEEEQALHIARLEGQIQGMMETKPEAPAPKRRGRKPKAQPEPVS